MYCSENYFLLRLYDIYYSREKISTYDGRSETAYLVAKLVLSYTLAKAPSQELA